MAKPRDFDKLSLEFIDRELRRRLRTGLTWRGVDKRTALGKLIENFQKAVHVHLAGEVSFLESQLIQKLAICEVALEACSGSFLERMQKSGGRMTPSAQFTGVFLRWLKEYRTILNDLGLKKRAKKLDLDDYLKSKESNDDN